MFVQDFDPNTAPGSGEADAILVNHLASPPPPFIDECGPGAQDPPSACARFDGPGGSNQPVTLEVEVALGSDPNVVYRVTQAYRDIGWDADPRSQYVPQHLIQAILKDELGNILYESTCIINTSTLPVSCASFSTILPIRIPRCQWMECAPSRLPSKQTAMSMQAPPTTIGCA